MKFLVVLSVLAISAAASEVATEENDSQIRDKRGILGGYHAALPVSYSSHLIAHPPPLAVAYPPIAKYVAPVPAIKIVQPYPIAKVVAPALPYAKLAYPSPVWPGYGYGYGYPYFH